MNTMIPGRLADDKRMPYLSARASARGHIVCHYVMHSSDADYLRVVAHAESPGSLYITHGWLSYGLLAIDKRLCINDQYVKPV